ncbi:MAG: hypothetical protein ACERKV_08905 [Clostridiaceae bacterium]
MEENNLLQLKKERNKVIGIKAEKIPCPCCTNKRLMDMVHAEKAELEIKCQKCGRTIHLYMEHDQIHAIAV